MARNKSTAKSDSAGMRAMKEQRAVELADPADEAKRHEALFLKGVGTAQDELRWLVEHEAWRTLGFESPVDWWDTRIRPAFVELEIRPAPSVARQILAAVEAHERGLPPAQRRSKKELARLALASDWVAQGRVEDRSKTRPASGADLGSADIVDAEIVDSTTQTAAGPEVEVPPSPAVGDGAPTPSSGTAATVSVPDPVDFPGVGSGTQTAAGESTLDDPADGVEDVQDPSVDTPAPDLAALRSAGSGVNPTDSSAGSERHEAELLGEDSDSREEPVEDQDTPVAEAHIDQSALVAQQPGVYHPSAMGETADTGAWGDGVRDETAGASVFLPQDGASAVDSGLLLVHDVEQFADHLEDVYDFEVIGPVLAESDRARLAKAVERIDHIEALLDLWKDKA